MKNAQKRRPASRQSTVRSPVWVTVLVITGLVLCLWIIGSSGHALKAPAHKTPRKTCATCTHRR